MKVSEIVELTKVIPELKGRVYYPYPAKNPNFPCVIISTAGKRSSIQSEGMNVNKITTFSIDVYHKTPSALEKLVESIDGLYTRNDIIQMGQYDAFDNKEGTHRVNLTYRVSVANGRTYRGA